MIYRDESENRAGLTKISFPLKPGEWPGLEAENMWAEPVSPGRYRVANVPFYVYGIGAEDVVDATLRDGVLTFAGVAERGGHSTYRLLLAEGIGVTHSLFLTYWRPLELLGCNFEGANRRWLAIDVPPHADIQKVYQLLEEGQSHGAWNVDEGYCGHPLANRDSEDR